MISSYTLKSLQILISILLIAAILLQAKGVGLSGFFSFGGGFYRSRRGLEKIIFFFTIFLATAFFVTSFFNLLLH